MEDDETNVAITLSELRRIDSWINDPDREILQEEASVQEDIHRCSRALNASHDVHSFGVSEAGGREHDSGTPENPLEHGDSAGRFADVRHIGQGAFGVVFLAYDRSLGIDVAIKLLRPSRSDVHNRSRFFNEAKTMARLTHPGIARVFDTGLIDGIPYITSSAANGGSLAQRIATYRQGLEPRQACEILLQVAIAVHSAHMLGVFHRDIKPGNILLHREHADSSGELGGPERSILTDFGLAKRSQSAGPHERADEERFLGTTRYMSPEQARGDAQQFGITSEVFTLGIVLYEMLTGVTPFTGATSAVIRDHILHGTATGPSSLRPAVPRALDAIVLKCLEKEPENRYPSVSHLAQDLTRFLNHEPVEATEPSWFQYAVSAARRRPIVAASVCLAGLAIATSSLVASVAWHHQRQAVLQEQAAKSAWMDLCGKIIDDIPTGAQSQEAMMLGVLHEAVSNLERELRLASDNEYALHRLSVMWHYASVVHGRMGSRDECIRARIHSCGILKRLKQRFPENDKYRFQWIYGCESLGVAILGYADSSDGYRSALTASGLPGSAMEILLPLEQEIEWLLNDFPDRDDYCDAAATFSHEIASYVSESDPIAAARLLDQAIRLSQALTAKHPDELRYAKPALLAMSTRASFASSCGASEQALHQIDEAIEFYNARFKQSESLAWVQREALTLFSARVQILIKAEAFQQALEACDDLDRPLGAWESHARRHSPFTYLHYRFLQEARRYYLNETLGNETELADREANMLALITAPDITDATLAHFQAIVEQYPVSARVSEALSGCLPDATVR